MSRRVTIHDVAAHAQVSHQTVSRVINQHALVSEAVRARVLQAMRDLDYSPSAAARSLAGGRTRLLGVLLGDVHNPYDSGILGGIEDVAYTAGYSVLAANISIDDHERQTSAIRALREQRVAGVIVATSTLPLSDLQPLLQAGITVASVDQRRPGVDTVTVDNVAAGRLAAGHLLSLGHRRIGMLTGLISTDSGRGRLVGYRRALRRAGLSPERSWQAVSRFDEHDAAEHARRMLARPDRPSALVTATNHLTVGALRVAADLGLRVPDDLAVVGFDELTWTPTLISPVTSVVQPTRSLGSSVCRLLLDRLDGRYSGPPRRLRLPASLLVSLSCGARAPDRHPAHRGALAVSLIVPPLSPDAARVDRGPGSSGEQMDVVAQGKEESA